MTKADTKAAVAAAKKLLDEHQGRVVETAWEGEISWSNVGLGKGVSGVVVGWGLHGPQVEVLERDRDRAALVRFFPGGGVNDGEGRTWRFT